MSRSLFVHRFLIRASLAAGNIFAWVFLFQALFNAGESATGALGLTALAYAGSQTIALLLIPGSARSLRHGARRAMTYATLAYATALYCLAASFLGFFGSMPQNVWWGIAGFVVLTGIYRALYFVPFAVERNLSVYPANYFLIELFLVLLPVAGGLFTSFYLGPQFLLLASALLALAALIPLRSMPDAYERFEWGYEETWRAFLTPRNRPVAVASFLDGVHGTGLLFVWPLTVFLLSGSSYFFLGMIISLTLLGVLLMRRILVRGALRRAFQSRNVTLTFLASSWIMRFTAFSPLSVVIADAVQHTGVPSRTYAIDPVTFEQAADSAHFIDEYTALKEMGLAIGRMVPCLVIAALTVSGSLTLILGAALAFSAAASLISFMIQRSTRALA